MTACLAWDPEALLKKKGPLVRKGEDGPDGFPPQAVPHQLREGPLVLTVRLMSKAHWPDSTGLVAPRQHCGPMTYSSGLFVTQRQLEAGICFSTYRQNLQFPDLRNGMAVLMPPPSWEGSCVPV